MSGKESGIDELRNMLASRDKRGGKRPPPPKYPAGYKPASATAKSSSNESFSKGGSGEDLTKMEGLKAEPPMPQGNSAALSSFPAPQPTAPEFKNVGGKSGVAAPRDMLNYAELQSAANSVRKELAQTSSTFLKKDQGPMSSAPQVPTNPVPSYTSIGQSTPDTQGVMAGGMAANLKAAPYMQFNDGKAAKATWSSREEANDEFVGMPPQKRAEKAMQYVKFWQKSGVTATALNALRSPKAFLGHLVQTWRTNEMSLNPTYVVLFLLATIFLSWNYLHPHDMPWRPDGLFYYHNTAYDTCVSHYRMCAKGLYVPEASKLQMDAAAISVPGRGGPLNSCTKAYVLVLLSDEYLPGVLTSLHMLRKYARMPADYVVVITPAVSEEVRQVLYQSCVIVRITDPVENPYEHDNRVSKKEQERKQVDPMDVGRKDMMTKIMIWALDEYENVVYQDADGIVLRTFDPLFKLGVQHGQLFAPARSYSDPQHFGSHIMSIHPAMDTLKQMLRLLEDVKEPAKKSEGDFLNDFFSDSWLGNPEHRLPWGLYTIATDLARSPRLVLEHVNKTSIGFKFIGDSTTKPWLKGMVTYKDEPEMMYFQKLWWKQYYEMTDRVLPKTIDMYSLLELSEYDLYWKQMYSPLTPRKWLG